MCLIDACEWIRNGMPPPSTGFRLYELCGEKPGGQRVESNLALPQVQDLQPMDSDSVSRQGDPGRTSLRSES